MAAKHPESFAPRSSPDGFEACLEDVMYIFATKQGAPDNPAWYYNLMNAGNADVEVGTDDFPVSVSEVYRRRA